MSQQTIVAVAVTLAVVAVICCGHSADCRGHERCAGVSDNQSRHQAVISLAQSFCHPNDNCNRIRRNTGARLSELGAYIAV